MSIKNISSLTLLGFYFISVFSALVGFILYINGKSAHAALEIHKSLITVALVLLVPHLYFHLSWLKKLFRYNKFRSFITSLMIACVGLQLLTSALMDYKFQSINFGMIHSIIGIGAITVMLMHLFMNRAWFNAILAPKKKDVPKEAPKSSLESE